MNYNNNICIIGKDINSIKNELNLIQDNVPNKLENLWNIISYEIMNISYQMKMKINYLIVYLIILKKLKMIQYMMKIKFLVLQLFII